MSLSIPQALRRATEIYRTPEQAAASLGMTVVQFANECLEYGILWPDTMVPAQLSSQRKDAQLAGELYRHRRAHLKECAA